MELTRKTDDVWTHMRCVDDLGCCRCGWLIPAGELFGATKPGPVHITCPTTWTPTVIVGEGAGAPTLPFRSLRAVEASTARQRSRRQHPSTSKGTP